MLNLKDVLQARQVVQSVVHQTPLDYSHTYSVMTGNEIFLKLENLQKTGSFKLRGAYNKLCSLSSEEKKRGVVTASAGNHAQGVAYSSKRAGIKSTVVMPQKAPLAKIEATQNYGAQVILYGNTFDEAQDYALKLQNQNGASFIHAFDDPFIIAGQGTVGLEILDQLPDVDSIVCPVGGGGLISGIALAVKEKHPHLKLYGVQAARCPSMLSSLVAKKPLKISAMETIADGIAVKRPGKLTFEIISRYVDDLVTVSDEEIAQTMLYLLERSKQVVEGAGAAALASLLFGKFNLKKQKVAVLVSGGNVDLARLPLWLSRAVRFPDIVTRRNHEPRHQHQDTFTQSWPNSVSRLYAAKNNIKE
jgi:threonine dehydratase